MCWFGEAYAAQIKQTTFNTGNPPPPGLKESVFVFFVKSTQQLLHKFSITAILAQWLLGQTTADFLDPEFRKKKKKIGGSENKKKLCDGSSWPPWPWAQESENEWMNIWWRRIYFTIVSHFCPTQPINETSEQQAARSKDPNPSENRAGCCVTH